MQPDLLKRQQEQIINELKSIHFMKKGSLTYQRVPARVCGVDTEAVYGPYPLLTWKENGQTKSMRLNSTEKVAWAEIAIANRRRFVKLCREYEKLAEERALKLVSELTMDVETD